MIEIRVRRDVATRALAKPMATGNAQSLRVKFLIDPKDRAWADKSLSASFEAVTHVGGRVTAIAPVTLDYAHGSVVIVPAAVLRDPAKHLYVGLHGTSPGHKDVDTNMVDIGPVRPGAGGIGFPAVQGASPRCGHQEDTLEHIWHMLLAKMADHEPLMRRMLAETKQQGAVTDQLRQEVAALRDTEHAHGNLGILGQIAGFATDTDINNLFE